MTRMLKSYLAVFAIRLTIFLSVLGLYLADKPMLSSMMTRPLVRGITGIHLLWAVFMGIMLAHIFPTERLSMAIRKAEPATFRPAEYEELALLRFVQTQNIRAWKVMLVWLSGNAVVGLLYLFHILDDTDLFLLTVFYFLCDYICILFFCPFQTFIMGNRCCVNCRIFDWGHFMMFTPMLFIRSFFSWSLFFTSCVVLIRWEIVYARHPERFWYGSNCSIQCQNCRDKLCKCKLSRKPE